MVAHRCTDRAGHTGAQGRAHHGVGEAGRGQLQLADVAGEAEADRLPGPEAEVDDHVPAGELESIWKLFGGARVQKKGGKK